MPNAFETPWVTLEVNDVPLSLCNDLGRPNLGMISWSSFFYHLLSLLSPGRMKSESEVAQSCLTLRNPMDCSPPGSSVHGIFQAGVLEWGAIAFSELYT